MLLAAKDGALTPRVLPDVKDAVGHLTHTLELWARDLNPVVLYIDPESGLITKISAVEDQADGQLQLTAAGQETAATVAIACHDSLAELLDGWSPGQEAELVALLRRVTTTLFSEENKKELISTPT